MGVPDVFLSRGPGPPQSPRNPRMSLGSLTLSLNPKALTPTLNPKTYLTVLFFGDPKLLELRNHAQGVAFSARALNLSVAR